MNTHPKIVLSINDYQRISDYLEEGRAGGTTEALEHELDRAEVVDAVDLPENVVSLYSRVKFLDLDSQQVREITIVEPPYAAEVRRGLVSVTSPLGAALIGVEAGETIDWKMPFGGRRSFRVLSVVGPRGGKRKSRAKKLAA